MGRLKVLAVTAGFFLILKVPTFAQYTAPAPSVLVSSDNDQSNVSVDSNQLQTSVADDQSQSSAANDQGEGLADTDWWWENEGLTVGYLGYGAGSCGAASQANRAWQPYTVWWTGDNVDPWFPARSLARFSNQSGWCNSYGYRNRSQYTLWLNRILLPTKKHHHLSNRKSNSNSNSEMRATAEQVPRELNRESNTDSAGPDDDWTRVEDHIEYSHPRQTAALARPLAQGTRGPQHGARSRNPRRAYAEIMRAAQRRNLAHARGFGTMHIAARPAAHISARSVAVGSGGRGHS
jgi:hypothetical protein